MERVETGTAEAVWLVSMFWFKIAGGTFGSFRIVAEALWRCYLNMAAMSPFLRSVIAKNGHMRSQDCKCH